MGAVPVTFPGLFDLQVNGFAGVDFNDPQLTADDLVRAIAAMRTTGVTRFAPTLITSAFESFARCAAVLAACPDPALVGIHMEGPYLADAARGAHPPRHLVAASVDDFKRRQEAARGRIVLVTLAPEVAGVLPLTEYLVGQGVRVAIGHTAANPAQIRDAVAAGATLSTHLGNGCAAMLPRHENILWEQLAADSLTACLIVDGHHLPESVVKVMVRAKTAARTVLVTDAIAAARQPPGSYTLGDAQVALSASGRVSMAGTGGLAGSALTLDAAVARTVAFTGLPLDQVLPMATVQPARSLGLQPAGWVRALWDVSTHHLEIASVSE